MPLSGHELRSALQLIDCVSITASDAVFEGLANRLTAMNDFQKQHYQESWSRTSGKFKEARNSATDLQDLLSRVTGVPYSDGIVSSDVSNNKVKINMANFRPKEGHMVVVHNGKYEMAPNETTDTRLINSIIDAVSDDTQAVIELGCGWGRNLASTALGIDRRDLTFVGLEQSADGLRCTEELLTKDPTIQFKTNAFDFYGPDFSELQNFDNIIVFSCAAIEQIAFISPDFIDQVMETSEKVTLILYEPIGWQRVRELQEFGVMTVLMEIMGKVSPDQHHTKNYKFELMNNAVLANAASWSIGGRYNLNLWSVVQHAVIRKVVDMTRSDFDISGMNPFNPYSLVVLEKRTPIH